MTWAAILRSAWRVLSFGVTIPVWAIIAVWLFFQYEQSAAVKGAIKTLVAGAEIEAANAKADALEKILESEREKAERLAKANADFAARLSKARTELGNLDDQISEILSRPVDSACVVDGDILGRLRNR